MHQFLFWQEASIRTTRRMPVTLENLNNQGGFSGTDAAMLEIAASLARLGHGVRVMAGGPASPKVTDGITYVCPEADDDDMSDVDVLVISFIHSHSPDELTNVFRRLTKPNVYVLLWLQCIFYQHTIDFVEHLTQEVGGQLTLVAVSDFVKEHIERRGQREGPRCHVIMNGINPTIFTTRADDKEMREPLSFVFCASYERGGRIAELVHNSLAQDRGWHVGEMRVFSYCDSRVASLSKHELAAMLRKSDYMVYPLVLDSGAVHHDTFACVVLEAMASGVLVVTWDVACFRVVYRDLITLVPPPPHAGYDSTSENGGYNHGMNSRVAVETLADAVEQLEAMPIADRESRRDRAREWALTQTWDKCALSVLEVVEESGT